MKMGPDQLFDKAIKVISSLKKLKHFYYNKCEMFSKRFLNIRLCNFL